MTPLQVVLPMAGLGSRFARAGFALPKPLIPVDGIPMFLKALSSLDGLGERRTAVVVQQAHVDAFRLDELLRRELPYTYVEVIPRLTRGAAESALACRAWLQPDAPLVVLDCDIWFRSASYGRMVADDTIDAGLLTFPASDPRYSYARVEGNRVVETAEKRVISERAITGAYFFRRAAAFIEDAEALLAGPLGAEPEYYMSSVFSVLLGKGGRVGWATVDEFASFGTPEELRAYQATEVG